MNRLRCAAAAALAAGLAAAEPAAAEPDLFSRQAFSGLLDLRGAVADGERGFLDGGFGKLRYGGGASGDAKARAEVADAALIWKPQFASGLSGLVDVEAQPEQRPNVDLVQAYLAYKPLPRAGFRYQLKAGFYWPEISLEHGGPAWSVIETITPSAINAWIGEEVKVMGAEAKLSRRFGGHELGVTAGAFTDNDTSATLLSFRGWALHDVKATAADHFPLPPLAPFMRTKQARDTRSRLELDNRTGWYGRLDWKPDFAPVSANLVFYDNRGDRVAVRNRQWSWETRFWNFGATARVGDRLRLSSQVMSGRTWMGFNTANGIWVDVKFASAYLLATYPLGDDSVSGRIDWFETRDQTTVVQDNNNEHGWSATAAWRHRISDHLSVLAEAVHVDSERPGRLYGGVAPNQAQSQLQGSLRVTF